MRGREEDYIYWRILVLKAMEIRDQLLLTA